MKNAILIPGTCDRKEYYSLEYPTASNFHWFPWLTKQLVVRDIHTVSVEMPHSYMPNYEVWKKELERFDITPETTLLGHSCGGGFLIRYLSENPDVHVEKVILVAPWLDPFDSKKNYFFDFKPNPKISSQVSGGITMMYSEDDMESVLLSVKQIEQDYENIKTRVFQDKGHFCLGQLGTEAFPELLKEIIAV